MGSVLVRLPNLNCSEDLDQKYIGLELGKLVPSCNQKIAEFSSAKLDDLSGRFRILHRKQSTTMENAAEKDKSDKYL